MIEIQNLSKSYILKGKKVKVFENFNFRIETGESIAILGRNGAGKSTLLRILGGIDVPDSGRVISDCSISWPVGLVGGFQGSLSARENVTFVSKIYTNGDESLLQNKIKKVEDFAEIGDYFDRPFKTYSNGMRSRVTFGLSMAFDFDVYLIDEVTSAGDERFRAKSKKYLFEKHSKSDFIMVDHSFLGLRVHCNRAFIIHEGQLIESFDVDEAIQIHKELMQVNNLNNQKFSNDFQKYCNDLENKRLKRINQKKIFFENLQRNETKS